jgi:hypothetical protein
MCFCAGLAFLTGCNVNVAGRERPLLRHGRIRGELELVARTHTDEHKTSLGRRKSKTEVYRENLRLKTTGDLYHQNLLAFSAALGVGLSQQRFSSDVASTSASSSLDEYDLSAEVLKKKPYPVRLYTSKTEYLTPRQFLGFLKTEIERSGLAASLRSKDWPMRFSYSTGKSRQSALASVADDFFDRDDEQYSYSLEHYFSRLSHMSFDLERNKVTQELQGSSSVVKDDNYSLLHDLIFGDDEQHRLDSFLSVYDQTEPTELTNVRWTENLRLQHSSTFRTKYGFHFTDRQRKSRTGQVTSSTEAIGGRAGFEHRLFESLVTTARVLDSRSRFAAGAESVVQGASLAFGYRKKNPWGRLSSGYSVGAVQLDQSGGRSRGGVVDERHIATELVPVELERVNVDSSSIVVKDSNGLFFQEGEDYRITEPDGRVMLEIITVGGIIPPNFTVGQEFFVDYEFFIEPKREEKTVSQNFNIRQRFSNGLSVFYAHRRRDEEVSSTMTNITADEFRINRFGAGYEKGAFSLRADYSKTESTAIPSTSKRLDGRYSWRLDAGSRASIQATAQELNFGQPDDRDITLFNFAGEVLHKLTNRYSVFAIIDYRDEDDTRFGITKGFQLRSELRYNYRQLRLTTGAAFNQFSRRDDENESVSFYIRLKRFF